jgi:hypothetical protein
MVLLLTMRCCVVSRTGDWRVIRKRLDAGEVVDAVDGLGCTALMHAARAGKEEAVVSALHAPHSRVLHCTSHPNNIWCGRGLGIESVIALCVLH